MHNAFVHRNVQVKAAPSYLALCNSAAGNSPSAAPRRPSADLSAIITEQHSLDSRDFDGGSLVEDQAGFQSLASSIQYGKGDALFSQAAVNQFVHFVMDGVVCVNRTLADGRRLVIDFALPGDFVGLWDDQECASSAEALGQVSTRRISREILSNFLQASPHLMRNMQGRASREVALAHDRMVLLGKYTAREKVAAFVVLMRDRWLRVNGQSIHVALPMSRQDIGDFLGVTLETVSRMIGELARERLIMVVQDGVRLLDLPRLRSIGQGHARTPPSNVGRRNVAG